MTDAAQQVIAAQLCGSMQHVTHAPGTFPYACWSHAGAALTALEAAGYRLIAPGAPKRYGQCDDTCTADCGHCKGAGPPGEPDDGVPRGGRAFSASTPMDPEAGE